MGIIMRNNIAYSGGGGSETVELSMAEYEAREAAGAIDSDTWYLIYDANDSYNAKKIVYDNAESGMEASTVQGAIDELKSNLETLGESVSNGKTLVANAITSKGVSTSTSASFETMANNINNIATATCRYLITYGRGNNIADSVSSSSNYNEYLQITSASKITVLKDCTLVIASMGDWEYSIQLTSNGSTKNILCCEYGATNEVCQVNNGLFSNAISAKAGDYITAPNIYGNYKYVLFAIF